MTGGLPRSEAAASVASGGFILLMVYAEQVPPSPIGAGEGPRLPLHQRGPLHSECRVAVKARLTSAGFEGAYAGAVGPAWSAIAASREFYEKLGFKMVSGDQSKNWVVLQNDNARIGLFQGMFPRNTLTFNPGWDSSKATLPDFEDVRDLQKTLKARGLTPDPAADESTTGGGRPRVLHAHRSRRQPDPHRPARPQPEEVTGEKD